MIKPTVGRIVWFTRRRDMTGMDEQPYDGARSTPFAAIVVYVHDDRTINLIAFDHDGYSHPARHVPLLQDDDKPPRDGNNYASWMPYQVGQAAKHEQAVGEKSAGEPNNTGTDKIPNSDKKPDALENPRPTV